MSDMTFFQILFLYQVSICFSIGSQSQSTGTYQYFLFVLTENDFFLAFDSKTSMRCYSEKTGPKYQICDKSYGFQTCFTKYDARKFSYSKLSRFSSNL